MRYFNIVVHGQVCNCVVVWNSHSAILGQDGTWAGAQRKTDKIFSRIVSSFSVSPLSSVHFKSTY